MSSDLMKKSVTSGGSPHVGITDSWGDLDGWMARWLDGFFMFFFQQIPWQKRLKPPKNEDLTDLTRKNEDLTIKILRNPWDWTDWTNKIDDLMWIYRKQIPWRKEIHGFPFELIYKCWCFFNYVSWKAGKSFITWRCYPFFLIVLMFFLKL